jgi:hypothetical protein
MAYDSSKSALSLLVNHNTSSNNSQDTHVAFRVGRRSYNRLGPVCY